MGGPTLKGSIDMYVVHASPISVILSFGCQKVVFLFFFFLIFSSGLFYEFLISVSYKNFFKAMKVFSNAT